MGPPRRRPPAGYPRFFASIEDCRVRNVDGNTCADLMCDWGPIVPGNRHPAVEAAGCAQAAWGACMNGPGAVLVDLAELLVEFIPCADWAIPAQNGTDATTACARSPVPAPGGPSRSSRAAPIAARYRGARLP